MNVNKKFDRFKQWTAEKIGGEAKTSVSDDFRALETEIGLRHDGMKENHKSMSAYVKNLSKRNEGEDKEKIMPVGYLGSTLAAHGEDFEVDSQFGSCLIAMGRTNERIARIQETYVAKASSTWLESLERSLTQMKEYQTARKKLETRRLAYDAAFSKMQKAKKEDFRTEEELRSQKVKYEESSEEVYRRMLDIKESEFESVADLTDFLDAELEYYDRCREILLQMKKEWPAGGNDSTRKLSRSRSNTAHSYSERYQTVEEDSRRRPAPPPPQPERPWCRPDRAISNSVPQSPKREHAGYDFGIGRPGFNRSTTFEGPVHAHRDVSPAAAQRMARVPSDSLSIRTQKAQLRSVSRLQTDCYDDPSDTSTFYSNSTSSPDRYFDEGGPSPATSHGSGPSRSFSSGTLNSMNGKKAPPPPPPRSKKPPPPPPMKRAAIGTGEY